MHPFNQGSNQLSSPNLQKLDLLMGGGATNPQAALQAQLIANQKLLMEQQRLFQA